jgi:hypothetical protein
LVVQTVPATADPKAGLTVDKKVAQTVLLKVAQKADL